MSIVKRRASWRKMMKYPYLCVSALAVLVVRSKSTPADERSGFCLLGQ